MPRVQDKGEKDYCLRVLADVCRRHVILPKSYRMYTVEGGEKWIRGGVADIWTGKLKERDVCIKVFRRHEDEHQRRLQGVGRTSSGRNTVSPSIIPGILLSRGPVEEHLASKRALFPGSFRIRNSFTVWLNHPPDGEQHQGLHDETPGCQQTAPGGCLTESVRANQLTSLSIAGRCCMWYQTPSFARHCAR